jgi:hypothetical protein
MTSSLKVRYAVGAIAALGCLAACGSKPDVHHDDAAVWNVASQQHLSPESTGFSAIVTRTGCSSGAQGDPAVRVIDYAASTITITLRIEPPISGGTCEGTQGVAYRVHLKEPIGTRTLVDGACIPPGTDGLETTSFCLHDGTRLSWRNGQPRSFYRR